MQTLARTRSVMSLVRHDRARARIGLCAALACTAALIVLGGGSASARSQAANGRIAYVSDGGCRFEPSLKNEDIFSMNSDGSGKVDLSRNVEPEGGLQSAVGFGQLSVTIGAG